MIYLQSSPLGKILILLLTWTWIATALPAQNDSPEPLASPVASTRSIIVTTHTLDRPGETMTFPPVTSLPPWTAKGIPAEYIVQLAYPTDYHGEAVVIAGNSSITASFEQPTPVNLKRADPIRTTTLTTVTLSDYGSTVLFPPLKCTPTRTATVVNVIQFEHPSDWYGEALIPHIYYPASTKAAEPTGA